MKKNKTIPKIPPLEYGKPYSSPLPEFNNTPDVFNDPKGIIFTPEKKRMVLDDLEKAYLQAWMSQKTLEITYQRFLHGFYDKGGLNAEALKNELARTQNEITIAEGMLNTIKEWYEHA